MQVGADVRASNPHTTLKDEDLDMQVGRLGRRVGGTALRATDFGSSPCTARPVLRAPCPPHRQLILPAAQYKGALAGRSP